MTIGCMGSGAREYANRNSANRRSSHGGCFHHPTQAAANQNSTSPANFFTHVLSKLVDGAVTLPGTNHSNNGSPLIH
jgi:hypothetical protein